MSKVVAGMAAVVLGGGTATASVIFLPKWLNAVDAELPDNLSTFKDNRQSEGCLRTLFGEMEKLTDETNNAISTEDLSNTPNTFLGDAKKTQSCLVVNWDKKTKTESGSNKWNGTFRLLWAVKGETKGFYIFLLGKPTKETSGSTHKLSWEGVAYILERKGAEEAKKWTEIKHAAVKNNASFVGSESDLNKLPVPGSALNGTDGSSTIPTFWGFFNAANELNNIDEAGKPEGDDVTEPSLRAYWKWDGQESTSASSTTKKLLDWTNNFETWWKVVFDETKFKVKDALANHQGSWEQKKYLSVQ